MQIHNPGYNMATKGVDQGGRGNKYAPPPGETYVELPRAIKIIQSAVQFLSHNTLGVPLNVIEQSSRQTSSPPAGFFAEIATHPANLTKRPIDVRLEWLLSQIKAYVLILMRSISQSGVTTGGDYMARLEEAKRLIDDSLYTDQPVVDFDSATGFLSSNAAKAVAKIRQLITPHESVFSFLQHVSYRRFPDQLPWIQLGFCCHRLLSDFLELAQDTAGLNREFVSENLAAVCEKVLDEYATIYKGHVVLTCGASVKVDADWTFDDMAFKAGITRLLRRNLDSYLEGHVKIILFVGEAVSIDSRKRKLAPLYAVSQFTPVPGTAFPPKKFNSLDELPPSCRSLFDEFYDGLPFEPSLTLLRDYAFLLFVRR